MSTFQLAPVLVIKLGRDLYSHAKGVPFKSSTFWQSPEQISMGDCRVPFATGNISPQVCGPAKIKLSHHSIWETCVHVS